MLQSPKNGKKENKKRQLKRNILNHSVLQTLLITRVFATNFDVGCLHASYERHFVKKIQHFCALKEQERNDTFLAPFALTARQLVVYRLPMVLPWAIFLLGLRPVFARNRLLVHNVLECHLIKLRSSIARNVNGCATFRSVFL